MRFPWQAGFGNFDGGRVEELSRTNATGGIVRITMTPLQGMTAPLQALHDECGTEVRRGAREPKDHVRSLTRRRWRS